MLLNEVPIGSIIAFPKYANEHTIVLGHSFDEDRTTSDGLMRYYVINLMGMDGLVENRSYGPGSLLQQGYGDLWKIVCLP